MRSPRTPLDLPNFNLNYQKTSFCEKLDFSVFSRFVFCQCRDSILLEAQWNEKWYTIVARWLGRFEPPVRPVRMKQCVRMAGSNLRFTPFQETGRSRLLLGAPYCYWAFSAMDWAFPIPIVRSRLSIGRSRLFRSIGNAMAFSAIPIYWDLP